MLGLLSWTVVCQGMFFGAAADWLSGLMHSCCSNPEMAMRQLALVQVVLDGIIAKPDACIWNLLLLTGEDRAVLDSARGVPSHLLPSGTASRHAKPRILSPRGYQLPVGIPGTPWQASLVKISEPLCFKHYF